FISSAESAAMTFRSSSSSRDLQKAARRDPASRHPASAGPTPPPSSKGAEANAEAPISTSTAALVYIKSLIVSFSYPTFTMLSECLPVLFLQNLEYYQMTCDQYQEAASKAEAHIRPRSTAPVCSGLQAQILDCYRDNGERTLSCSGLAKEYMLCVNAAKKVGAPTAPGTPRAEIWEWLEGTFYGNTVCLGGRGIQGPLKMTTLSIFAIC
uniref:CHCH domain-containing protein n=1 Tax=Paramormyrops kingsleyae TaxID=1676925 RepID=A0A3B3TEK5_9TELE